MLPLDQLTKTKNDYKTITAGLNQIRAVVSLSSLGSRLGASATILYHNRLL